MSCVTEGLAYFGRLKSQKAWENDKTFLNRFKSSKETSNMHTYSLTLHRKEGGGGGFHRTKWWGQRNNFPCKLQLGTT